MFGKLTSSRASGWLVRSASFIQHQRQPVLALRAVPNTFASRGITRGISTSRSLKASEASSESEAKRPSFVADPVKLQQKILHYERPEDITPLKEARSIYARIHIFNRSFLVTEGDKVSIPVRVKDVAVGDVLNFDQVSELGSRDYTLTGSPRIDPSVFKIKARVIEITRVKREVKEKTKRRRRHVRHIPVKNVLTVLRISELKVNQDY